MTATTDPAASPRPRRNAGWRSRGAQCRARHVRRTHPSAKRTIPLPRLPASVCMFEPRNLICSRSTCFITSARRLQQGWRACVCVQSAGVSHARSSNTSCSASASKIGGRSLMFSSRNCSSAGASSSDPELACRLVCVMHERAGAAQERDPCCASGCSVRRYAASNGMHTEMADAACTP